MKDEEGVLYLNFKIVFIFFHTCLNFLFVSCYRANTGFISPCEFSGVSSTSGNHFYFRSRCRNFQSVLTNQGSHQENKNDEDIRIKIDLHLLIL